MGKEVLVYYFLINRLIVKALPENTTISVSIPDKLGNDLNDSKHMNILRYGHHRTQACQDFEKAYVCIMKCLELGFQIAESDKNCRCKCFKDSAKQKYDIKVTKGWSIPTSSLPPWAPQTNYSNNIGTKDSHEVIVMLPQNKTENSIEEISATEVVSEEENTNEPRETGKLGNNTTLENTSNAEDTASAGNTAGAEDTIGSENTVDADVTAGVEDNADAENATGAEDTIGAADTAGVEGTAVAEATNGPEETAGAAGTFGAADTAGAEASIVSEDTAVAGDTAGAEDTADAEETQNANEPENNAKEGNLEARK